MTVPDTDTNATSPFSWKQHFKPGKPLQVISVQAVPESHGLKVMAQVHVHGNTWHTWPWPSFSVNQWDQREDITFWNMLIVKAL